MRYARFTAGDHWSPLQTKVKFVRKIRVKSVRKIRVRSVRREYANYSKTRQFYTTYSPCSCRGDQWSPASLSIAPTKSKPLSLAQTPAFPQSSVRRENPYLRPLQKVLEIPKTLSQKGLWRGSGQRPARLPHTPCGAPRNSPRPREAVSLTGAGTWSVRLYNPKKHCNTWRCSRQG